MTDPIALATRNQHRATDVDRSVWVGASAGSGKTTVLTNRVLALLLEGVAPHRILCITFTKAAAAEMTARIASRLAAWATLPDRALDVAIAQMRGRVPSPAQRERARTLFATLIDGEGTVQIQTIHAFCQAVLGRFPLEAGIAPNFEVMDERTGREMLADAQRAVLAAAGQEGPLADALAAIAVRVGEERFASVLGQFASERGRLRRAVAAFGGTDGVAEALAERLGLPPGTGLDEAAFLAEACGDAACEAERLRVVARALLGGKKTDIERGEGLAAWLSAPVEARVAGFDDYARLFFTGGGTPVQRLATAGLAVHLDVLQAEQARLAEVLARCRAARLVQLNAGLLRLAHAVLDRYDRQKAAHGRLDYDDLILATRNLLHETPPGWVHWKLDGGIDHVLVDEAQDTNPDQWAVIEALVEEFFAGQGVERPAARTLFVVGDRKQSIYGFQRAAPEQFETMRGRLAERAGANRWQDLSLDVSFRTVPGLLEVTDTVFAGTARAGVVGDGETLRHIASRIGHGGRLEVWPMTQGEPAPAEDPWQPARDYARARSGEALLAARIAETIAGWIARGDRLASTGAPVRAADVMILLRRRGRLMAGLVRALKQAGVPVAGVDRLRLEDELAVQDLVALGRFLLLPDDDLTLAAVLKSPLVGLDEEALLALACDRGRDSLWSRLRASADPDARQARDFLAALLARVDFLTPHAFYADLLGRGGGRERLVSRLGAQANDAIDEFLAAALAHARSEPPSLQGFLHWLDAGAGELKRDLEQAERDEVRIITVHGAKGLEAPVVFLPDATWISTNAAPPPFWIEADGIDLPLWSPSGADDDPVAAAARERWRQREQEEHHRLLYVAMTRARDRLIVCGACDQEKPPERAWYPRVAEAARAAGAEETEDGGLVLETPQEVPPAPPRRTARTAAAPPPLPGWFDRPAPDEPGVLRVAPSHAGADEPGGEEGPPVVSPLAGGAGANRFRRGLLIHALLQHLPQRPPAERAAAGRRWLARQGMAEPAAAAVLSECLAILDDPVFAPIFGPGSRAEVPVAGLLDGRRVAGQIDRLLVTPEAIMIVDYKSLRPPPTRAEAVPRAYLRQMAAYRALLAAIHPGRPVRCALLWTETPRLMPLPDALLDGAAGGAASP